jgi:uncharacterized protein YjiK
MSTRWRAPVSVLAFGAAAVLGSGCSNGPESDSESGSESTAERAGSVGLRLQVAPGKVLSSVSYTITGPQGFIRTGAIDVSRSNTVSAAIGGLPAGTGFSITLVGETTDGSTQCMGSASFDVIAGATMGVTVRILCQEAPRTGSVRADGTINICPVLDGISASPAEVNVGASLALEADAHDSDAGPAAIAYQWTTTGGTLSANDVADPSLTCTAAGDVTVSVTATDGDCSDTLSATVTCSVSAGSATTIDLSKYRRVARYPLPEPSNTVPPNDINLLAQEASAVTYDWDTDSLFVTGDGGTAIVQVSKTGALLSTMTLAPGGSPQGTEFFDPEGIAYVGGGKFVFTEERDRQVVLFTYVGGATLQRADAQTVKLGTSIGNVGLEGVTFDLATGRYLFVKEAAPKSIFETGIDFAAGTATNGSPTAVGSIDLFDPALINTLDFSDIYALTNLPSLQGDPTYNDLLILSQESGQVVQVDRAGSVKHTMTLVKDPTDIISIPDMTIEGITLDRDGNLYLVSENGGGDFNHPELWVYSPSTDTNLPPTAISLPGAVTSLPETADTSSAAKVADIFVTDDGLGDNDLVLSGPDAASFQIIGTALFLRAGTALDAATKPAFDVTVSVDDTTVGATPDASVAYTLTISAGAPGSFNLAITEVAPWSSGNSPLAADWFEVTNFGTSPVSLAGFSMDDNSNSAALAVPLSGVASIAPGESVIFIETNDLPGKAQAFVNLWFGGTAPAGLQIGSYSGAGVGLSTGGDAVNLYDSGGSLRAAVSFGVSPSGPTFPTFDNSEGLNNAVISTLSALGVSGAFAAAQNAVEIGSPGTASASLGGSPIVGITALDATASETGSDPGVFRFTRTGSTTSSLSIVYVISAGPGHATADDYTPLLTGSLTIPSGASFLDVTITPVDDALVEGTETLTLTLSDTGSYDVGAAESATVTIVDNDAPAPSSGGVVISEVAPWSSGNSTLGFDWFEVTNTGDAAVDITGWKMDDNSHAFANAVALNGITSIAPGEAVIFVENADLAAAAAAFRNLWFGTNPQRPVPQIGSYTGSGVGLSTGGDEVVLFNAAGAIVTGVAFGASPGAAPFATFDNHAGAGSNALPFPIISALSAIGVNGAHAAAGDANEIGSPGIGNVGRLIVTEVAPWGSGGTSYAADWFEVTNVGSAAVSLTDWKMDDNSNSVALAVALTGVSSIAPGESVIFLEGSSTQVASFITAWFGASPPAGLQIGTYSGSGIGLSTSGDAVNLFNAAGNRVFGVSFGASTTNVSFDNLAGLTTVTALSALGVNGAFLAANGLETGSPGRTQ